MDRRHWLIEFFRWDARATLAATLGLLVLIGVTWAATASNLLATFDFGGASSADLASGAIPVKGALTQFPATFNNLQFGWTTTEVFEATDKVVVDKLRRDSNSGVNGATFRIVGLDAGNYNLKFTVGSSTKAFSTRITSGARATSVSTAAGNWQAASLAVAVDNTGVLNLVFTSANGTDNWGVSALAVYLVTGTPATPSFAVSVNPTQATIKAGDTAVFRLGVTALQNYASKVSAEISGLVAGMTAEFTPAELNSPPGALELAIYTMPALSPTTYNLDIIVKGSDSGATQQNISVKLTVTASGNTLVTPVIDPVTHLPVNGTSSGGIGETPDLPPRTAQEVGEDFKQIEAFAEEQQVKAVQRKNFLELGAIGDALSSGAPALQSLPEAKSTTESFLQKLVGAGIIPMTTDTAPPVQDTAKPQSLWQRIIGGIFNPAN